MMNMISWKVQLLSLGLLAFNLSCSVTSFTLKSTPAIRSQLGKDVYKRLALHPLRERRSETSSGEGESDHPLGDMSDDSSRRSFLSKVIKSSTVSMVTAFSIAVQPSFAGEVGAKITKAVTTSDLGISVRTSVVRGAQMMDKLDGKWEKFSDDNGLGAERLKAGKPPKPKEIPPNMALNVDLAEQILVFSDESFLELTGLAPDVLQKQINKVDGLVRKSFERSGLNLQEGNLTAEAFSYYCYCHFKSYCDIIIESKMKLNRKEFESILGNKLLPLLAPSASKTLASLESQSRDLKSRSKESLSESISAALSLTDEIMANLVSNGLVALAERNDVDSEKLADWTDDLTDIVLSIPLDGDITLNSQLLLQEQGFRLYPDFGRFCITSALQKSLAGTGQSISSDEYYMDNNYSSDPALFEVKQVLINIVIDST